MTRLVNSAVIDLTSPVGGSHPRFCSGGRATLLIKASEDKVIPSRVCFTDPLFHGLLIYSCHVSEESWESQSPKSQQQSKGSI